MMNRFGRGGFNRKHLTFGIALIWIGVTVVALRSPRATAEDNAASQDMSAELPRIPPTSPADALATFTVADGFEMQLVASEPLLSSPVAIEWDSRGRMYVCEMRGYSEDQDDGISRINRLEDTDQDGVYDTTFIYADGLRWPTAIFPFDDGLFVADAPHIYYLKDTTGDGEADQKKIVLTGFGTSNVQGLLNSFRWGLDNRIHVACSSVGGTVRRPQDEKGINVRGRDIAFDPRTYQFSLTSGAAQHGMCFDDWGRKFVSSNSNHIQQVMYEDRYVGRNPLLSAPSARLMIAADGPQAEVYRTSPVEPWRIVRTRLRVGGIVPGPIEGGGRAAGYFTGATGVTIYRGDAWPREWEGIAIIGDVGSNLVHRKRLTRDGLEFTARRIDSESEFVTSKDIWFRPAQFANAPDGTLYVIDVCREVIEHPKSLPPEIKKHLDLTSGRDRGRVFRIAPDGFKYRPTPDLSEATTDALVGLLDHPNAWHRETAARLLFQRQDQSAAKPLRELASHATTAQGRLHAMYALAGLGLLNEEIVSDRLSDSHAQVRRHAIRLAEQFPRSGALATQLADMSKDESMEVRHQLAFTLGSFDGDEKVDVLADLIRQDSDSRWIRSAVQSSTVTGAGELFAKLVRDPEFRSSGAGIFLGSLAAQIGQQDRENDILAALSVLPELPTADAAFALPVIGTLTATRSRSGSQMQRLAKSGDLKQVDAMTTKLILASLALAMNESADPAQRSTAVQSLSYGTFEDVGESLVTLIDNRQPHQVQQSAITTLGKFRSAPVAPPLLQAWKGLSPSLRATAAEVLFARPDRTLNLFDAVDAGSVTLSTIGKARLQVAAKSKHAKIKRRALEYLKSTGSRNREEIVKAYSGVFELAGDLERGRGLFKKHCSVCHKVEGVGHEIGPSLATIKTRGAETILVNVLDPNREVNPEYLNYVLLTEDGRAMTGMISAETASSITLRRAEAATDTVLRVDIDQLQSTGLSIMPEGMDENLDPQAMADVIEYLMKVK